MNALANKPIRVLQIIGSMNRGGAETMIMNLYRNIDKSKVQFDFVENSFGRAAFDDEIESLGGRIYRCPHYTGKNHFHYVKWWHVFFRQHADEYAIVHGHLGSTAAIYLKIAKKYGLYTIAHSHNVRTQNRLSDMLYACFAYPTRYISDQFFACSRAAGISRYGKHIGGNQDRCLVLNNAIKVEKFAFDPIAREEMRKQLNLESNTVIGHVGRFCPQKNHLFLLKIFRAIHQMEPQSKLLLVGDGDLREKIEEKISDYNLTDDVILVGVQDNVMPFYQAMDVLVFPSLYEGLPVTLVEAQANGLPCVISDFVPKECILTKELITTKTLEDSCDIWAQHILERIGTVRESHAAEVAAHGYDINLTAKWLCDFYMEKATI